MAAGADLHTLVVGREAMGCRFEMAFNAGEVAEATELACDALDLVAEIEARLSVYRDTSELAALNAAAGAWVAISDDTLAMLALARELHDRTAGAFDVAAGPLVRSWGFLRRQGRIPAEADRLAALAASGTRWLELDPTGRRARLLRSDAAVDPGGIGKGWAVDHAVEMLSAAGVPSVLVHGGQSSVRAMGRQGPADPGRAGWRVGLRHPLRPGRRLATIRLQDRALGTSGSGTSFFVERGRRFGHVLDPRTGLPAEGVLSATVLAATAAEADALATAAFVAGESGLHLIAPPGSDTAAILVLPPARSGLRIVAANIDESSLAIEPEPGLELVWTGGPRPD